MKKQNLINLVKYHVDRNEDAFVSEVAEIAREFDRAQDYNVAEYLMELIANANAYVPQSSYDGFRFLTKLDYSTKPLLLPTVIEEDVLGIARAIKRGSDITKFLFYGAPGTGKTEAALQVARLTERDILSVNIENLIDSRLGETAKNIVALFDEINHLPYNQVMVILDEIDSLILNRIANNDHREMGRATSAFIRALDSINDKVVMIATTNLIDEFDKAILRRFDATVSFDRYSKEDLIEVADAFLTSTIKKYPQSKQNKKLFNKILSNLDSVPYPGDLKQIIKTAVAFSDGTNEYDYLRKIYYALNGNPKTIDLKELKDAGYTTREIEILSRVPRSSVARKLSKVGSDE